MNIPASLRWLASEPGGAEWLEALPRLLDAVVVRWRLKVTDPPFAGGNVAYVVRVLRGRERLVLKLQWPHPESACEALALRTWNGRGAVRLVAHDRERHALLLEECRPGGFLADSGDPISALTGLLPQLWVEPGAGFRPLSDEARAWARSLPRQWEEAGRPCDRRLVDAALYEIDRLAGTQGAQVLIHQDLHGHNVLSAERAPWLAIDPKPLSGERAFSLAPIVRSFEFGHTAKATVARLDRLAAALDLDRDRALGWTVAQTMAWGFGGAFDAHHHQTVRWLLDAR